jgi:hypothetical protein
LTGDDFCLIDDDEDDTSAIFEYLVIDKLNFMFTLFRIPSGFELPDKPKMNSTRGSGDKIKNHLYELLKIIPQINQIIFVNKYDSNDDLVKDIQKVMPFDNNIYGLVLRVIEARVNKNQKFSILAILLLFSDVWNIHIDPFHMCESSFINKVKDKLYKLSTDHANKFPKYTKHYLSSTYIDSISKFFQIPEIKNIISTHIDKKYSVIYFLITNMNKILDMISKIELNFLKHNLILSILMNVYGVFMDKDSIFKLDIDEYINRLNNKAFFTILDIIPVFVYVLLFPNIIIDILTENTQILFILNEIFDVKISKEEVKEISDLAHEIKHYFYDTFDLYYVHSSYLNILLYMIISIIRVCCDMINFDSNKKLYSDYINLLASYESELHNHEFKLMFNNKDNDLYLFMNQMSTIHSNTLHLYSVMMKVFGVNPVRRRIMKALLENKSDDGVEHEISMKQVFYSVFLSECLDLRYMGDVSRHYNYTDPHSDVYSNMNIVPFNIDSCCGKLLKQNIIFENTVSKKNNNDIISRNMLINDLEASGTYLQNVIDILNSDSGCSLCSMDDTGKFISYIRGSELYVSYNYGYTFHKFSNVDFIHINNNPIHYNIDHLGKDHNIYKLNIDNQKIESIYESDTYAKYSITDNNTEYVIPDCFINGDNDDEIKNLINRHQYIFMKKMFGSDSTIFINLIQQLLNEHIPSRVDKNKKLNIRKVLDDLGDYENALKYVETLILSLHDMYPNERDTDTDTDTVVSDAHTYINFVTKDIKFSVHNPKSNHYTLIVKRTVVFAECIVKIIKSVNRVNNIEIINKITKDAEKIMKYVSRLGLEINRQFNKDPLDPNEDVNQKERYYIELYYSVSKLLEFAELVCSSYNDNTIITDDKYNNEIDENDLTVPLNNNEYGFISNKVDRTELKEWENQMIFDQHALLDIVLNNNNDADENCMTFLNLLEILYGNSIYRNLNYEIRNLPYPNNNPDTHIVYPPPLGSTQKTINILQIYYSVYTNLGPMAARNRNTLNLIQFYINRHRIDEMDYNTLLEKINKLYKNDENEKLTPFNILHILIKKYKDSRIDIDKIKDLLIEYDFMIFRYGYSRINDEFKIDKNMLAYKMYNINLSLIQDILTHENNIFSKVIIKKIIRDQKYSFPITDEYWFKLFKDRNNRLLLLKLFSVIDNKYSEIPINYKFDINVNILDKKKIVDYLYKSNKFVRVDCSLITLNSSSENNIIFYSLCVNINKSDTVQKFVYGQHENINSKIMGISLSSDGQEIVVCTESMYIITFDNGKNWDVIYMKNTSNDFILNVFLTNHTKNQYIMVYDNASATCKYIKVASSFNTDLKNELDEEENEGEIDLFIMDINNTRRYQMKELSIPLV